MFVGWVQFRISFLWYHIEILAGFRFKTCVTGALSLTCVTEVTSLKTPAKEGTSQQLVTSQVWGRSDCR